jgi:hypothetical protein
MSYYRYLPAQHGNSTSLLDNEGQRPRLLTQAQVMNAGWMFKLVFDDGEHDVDMPKLDDSGMWDFRNDPFSSYRAGFEVRICRLCQRRVQPIGSATAIRVPHLRLQYNHRCHHAREVARILRMHFWMRLKLRRPLLAKSSTCQNLPRMRCSLRIVKP